MEYIVEIVTSNNIFNYKDKDIKNGIDYCKGLISRNFYCNEINIEGVIEIHKYKEVIMLFSGIVDNIKYLYGVYDSYDRRYTEIETIVLNNNDIDIDIDIINLFEKIRLNKKMHNEYKIIIGQKEE